MSQRDRGSDSQQSGRFWAVRDDIPHGAGDRIGDYEIVSLIGEGGYGLVFHARQVRPVQRDVALKILKPGMDSRQVVLRFEAERQALAMMDHPGVAKVFDAGQTDAGRPYFAMEHFPGTPLTLYCDEHRLTIDERIEMFLQVCDAVQHAHTKGVVHRDLKPGNILVREVDNQRIVKVIDFGLAKAIQTNLSDDSLVTQQGQMIGTPQYMSPEQATFGGARADTRSDVYSLGVVLYELLTGMTPFSIDTETSVSEWCRVISDVLPPRPTLRVSRESDSSDGPARSRQLDRKSLATRLRGDLDWIVMKCLEKVPGRRYETVSSLAMDLRRHKQSEPVLAGPPGARYRLGKFLRRNRAAAMAASVVLLVLIAATVVSVQFAIAERHHRQRAQAKETRALEAEARAKAQAENLRTVAEFQGAMLSEVDGAIMGAQLREDVFQEADAAWRLVGVDEAQRADRSEALQELLAGANFTNAAVRSFERSILANSLRTIEQQFDTQPRVQAMLLDTVGEIYYNLGRFDEALQPKRQALQLRRARFGDEHSETATSLHNVGRMYRAAGQYEQAESYLRDALALYKRTLGEDHPETLASLNSLGMLMFDQGRLDEAEQYCRQALRQRQMVLGDEDRATLASLNDMARLRQAQGNLDEAETLYRQALTGRQAHLGENHPETLRTMNNLGRTLRERGDLEQAETYYRRTLEGFRAMYGDDHPSTLGAMNNLGRALREQNRLDEAETYYSAALEGFTRVLGEDHPDTLVATNNMGRLLRGLGRIDEAETMYRRSLAGRRRVLGDDHMGTITAVNNLAYLLQSQGKLQEAEAYFMEALAGVRRAFDDDHPNTIRLVGNVAQLLREQGKYDDAEPYYQEAIAGFERVMGQNHHETLNAMSNYVLMLCDASRFEDAVQISETLVQRAAASLPADHRTRGYYLRCHARALQGAHEFVAAEQALTNAHATLVAALGESHEQTLDVAEQLASLYAAWGEAEPQVDLSGRAENWIALVEAEVDDQ